MGKSGMPYEILIHELAAEELEALRAYDQRRIVTETEEQLSHQPTVLTRRRKCLESLAPSFEHEPPVWQPRIGDFRVFYDVEEESRQVHIRAVRHTDPEQTTEEIA
ncbi:MAG: type II toxin-antitoxin system RelE family toxin [Planctomycetaceae bacterium]